MAEQETYVKAKLAEVNSTIERMTEMLNKMVEVLTRLSELPRTVESLTQAVRANNERVEELVGLVKNISEAGIVTAGGEKETIDRAGASAAVSLLETLDSQIRDGVIASDLAKKIGDTADVLSQRGAPAALVVKIQRWVRILKTYGRVDPVSPADIGKLKTDLREWIREIQQSTK